MRPSTNPEDAPRGGMTSGLRLPGLVGSSSLWKAIDQECAELIERHVLITGEPGSGKLAVALAMAGLRGATPALVGTGDVAAQGAPVWLESVSQRLADLPDDRLVVVSHLERLEPPALETLAALLDTRTAGSVATMSHDTTWAETSAVDATGIFTVRAEVPALRHRPEDIPELARHFDLRLGRGRLTWTSEATQLMQRYFWPGNVRELEDVVRGVLAESSPTVEVTAERLPEGLRRRAARRLLTRLERAEVDVILAALAEAKGNKERAAQLIGMHRATLYRKIHNYGLDLYPHVF